LKREWRPSKKWQQAWDRASDDEKKEFARDVLKLDWDQ
jgi:hypothetical protein